MSEFLSNEVGDAINQPPEEKEVQPTEEPTKFETDVKDVFADDVVKQGHNEFPVFKCTKNDFYGNMTDNRKRLRFQSGSSAQQYMQQTKYKNAFYVSYTDSDNKTYRRKVK